MAHLIWVAWATNWDNLNYYTGCKAWKIKDAPLLHWGGASCFNYLFKYLLFKICVMKFLIRLSKVNVIWQKIRSLCNRSDRRDDDFSDNPYLIL